MNQAHWHLVVNHFPIIFPIVGIIVMISGLIIKSSAVKNTAYMIFILGSLATVFAMKTGDEAQDMVENISGVTENYVDRHEEAAEVFAVFSYILGSISLIGFYCELKKIKLSLIYSIITLLFSIIVLFFGKQTGTTGGEIRHTEIRQNGNINIENTEKIEDDHKDD
ncbi:MAG: hypothetical protein ACOVQ2_01990 [Flavobacterium sp.]